MVRWEDQMPELRKIREVFTKKVAQDIFDILTPNSASGRSTSHEKEQPSQVEKDGSESGIPFFVDSKNRSNLDEVASFNRIPSDRAQDAIIYFIEEILRLKELKSNVKVSEQKKKAISTDPTRDEDKEVYQKQYILTADENGVLHRLTISHTFLKIEERSFRPSATKTKKTKKPVYQLCWKPIRATKVLGQFQIVSYPTETVMFNNRTNMVDRIPFKDDSLDKWTNAIEIGKSNLIAMALDLRNTCYLVLFDGQEPYQALLESDILKYFKIISDLIYNVTKLDPFSFRKLGEEIRIRQQSRPHIETRQTQRDDNEYVDEDLESEFSVEIKGSPFGESFIFTAAEFLPSLIGDVLSPVFKIDIVDEKSVAKLLFEVPKNAEETSEQKELFRYLADVALKNPLPTLENATKPFRSLWFLNGSCNFEINYQSTEEHFEKEKTKIKRLSSNISVGSRTKPYTKSFMLENQFVLHLKFLEKNSVAFILGPASASATLKAFVNGDISNLANDPNITTSGLVFVGLISYGESMGELNKNKLSLELIKVWCAEKEKDSKGHILQNVLHEYGAMYFEFLCDFAKLYAMPEQKSYLYMDMKIKESFDPKNSNLVQEDIKYLLDSVIFVNPEQVMIGDSDMFIRQLLSVKDMPTKTSKSKSKNSSQQDESILQPPQAPKGSLVSNKATKPKIVLNLKTQPTLVENVNVVNVFDADNLEINDSYPRGMDKDIPLAKKGISETELTQYIESKGYVRSLAQLSMSDIYQIDTNSLVPIAVLWDGDYIIIGNVLSALILQYLYAHEDTYDTDLAEYQDEIREHQIPTHHLNLNIKGYKKPILLQVLDLPDLGDLTPDDQQEILNPYLKQLPKGIVPTKATAKAKK
jgi:hypothetical protein